MSSVITAVNFSFFWGRVRCKRAICQTQS